MAQQPKKIEDVIRPKKRYQVQKKYPLASVLIGLLVVVSIWVGWQWSQSDMRTIEKNTYQAVNLSNDQIYFGKITNISSSVITIENVYYMANTSSQKNNVEGATAQTNVLRPLEKAIYGPENILYLRKEQIVSWQNLKNDSQVVKTIQSR